MKILPKWYRADNTMWFAQTGTTMHMAVFKRFVTNNEGLENVETTVYASLVEGEDKQDGNMVLSIMESVFKHYKTANPGITDIHCKADNGKHSLYWPCDSLDGFNLYPADFCHNFSIFYTLIIVIWNF